MKKIIKTLAFMSALCMTASMAAALPVSAAEVKGDVDGDGYLTGHDAAVTSRYLHEGDVALTRAQLAIADVDGNGKVEQADADWMQANRQYALGDTELTGEIITKSEGFVREFKLASAYDALMTCSAATVYGENVSMPMKYQRYQEPLMQSLMDVTGDSEVTVLDAYLFLFVDNLQAVLRDGWQKIYQDGRYYVDYTDARLKGTNKKGNVVGGINGKDIIDNGNTIVIAD